LPLHIDSERGKKAAEILFNAFSGNGIFGRTEMPEDILPEGVEWGSLKHLLFITLTVSIDYQRDAVAMWESSRKSFADPETDWLYDLELLSVSTQKQVVEVMQKHGLSKKTRKDAHIWRTVGTTFFKKWKGDPRNFLADADWDAPTILERLKDDTHLYNKRNRNDYPYLRGDKIGPLWLRMLRDNVGLDQLKNLDKVPIPVDVHIARATAATGVVRGKFDGNLSDYYEIVRKAWFQSVRGVDLDGRPMIALDVDEPLWHLSKYGCTKRKPTYEICPLLKNCPAKDFCIFGIVSVNGSSVVLNTSLD
jgi:hypothetical protein